MGDGHITWATLASAVPDLAREGRRLLAAAGDTGHAFLVTVRGADVPPRVHPVTVGFVGDGMFVFLLRSANRRGG